MKEKSENFLGFNQTVGVLQTTTANWDGTTHTYPGNLWAPPLNGSEFKSLLTLTVNQNNMVRQVKAAVFTVVRNEDNKVTSAEFVKELWVEVKNGSSLELAVAKELDKDFDPNNTVVKEIYSVTF